MAAKLTFADVFQNELNPAKINFGSLNIAMSIAAGAPSHDASVGALYIDQTAGILYRKTASGGSNWIQIGNGTGSSPDNHYRLLTVNSAVTSADMNIGDLVGIFGAGAFSSVGNMSTSRVNHVTMGSANAALVTGGNTGTGGVTPTAVSELFNGSTWSATGALAGVGRQSASGVGNQNAGFIASGGVTAAFSVSSTDMFNGSTWAASTPVSQVRASGAGVGTFNGALLTGGLSGIFGAGPYLRTSELFNGTAWAAANADLSISKSNFCAGGTLMAGLIAGGTEYFAGAVISATEMFNGTSWSMNANAQEVRQFGTYAGTLNAGLMVGGGRTNATTGIIQTSYLFNGSVWSVDSPGLATAARSFNNTTAPGSQNLGLVVGGNSIGNIAVLTTELHTQSTHRKMYSRYMATANKIGILSATNTVTLQGKVGGIIYPANKYMVMNRSALASVTNQATLSAITFQSVLGTAPTMTYNFSTTSNLLSVLPGMVVSISSSGASPVTSNNVGTFVISRVISPSSIEIQNIAGTAQNPGTGTLSIISSMVAVDNISPQDIVVGKTDSSGNLFIAKPLQVGSLIKRLK